MRIKVWLYLLLALPLLAHGFIPSVEFQKRIRPLRAPGSFILVAWSTRPPLHVQPRAGLTITTEPDLGQAWSVHSMVMSAALNRSLRTLPLGGVATYVSNDATIPPIVSAEGLTAALSEEFQGDGWVLLDAAGKEVHHEHLIGSMRAQVLLDKKLHLLKYGQKRLPTPEEIQDLMERSGWVWKRPLLQAYLREHPSDGQARVELLADLAHQLRALGDPALLQTSLHPILEVELDTQMHALLGLPDLHLSWRQPMPNPLLDFVEDLHASHGAQEAKGGLGALWAILKARMHHAPESASAWYLGMLISPKDAPLVLLEELNRLSAVPGRPWPPLSLHKLVAKVLPAEPAAVAMATRHWIESNTGLQGLDQGALVTTWGALGFKALLLQNALEEAQSHLEWIHGLSGASWTAFVVQVQPLLEARSNGPDRPAMLKMLRALKEPPIPKGMAKVPLPLRLGVLESRQDVMAWALLQTLPSLDAWDPRELLWTSLRPGELAALRRRDGWGSGQRWILMRGEEVLDSEPGLPTPSRLEAALRAQGTPRLAQLDAFLRAHPEREDAQWERLEWIRPRLPHPTLEPLFRRELARLARPIGDLPVPPEPALWQADARTVCTRLQDELQRWPFHETAWEAYADWSAYAPDALPVSQLLRQTPTWPEASGRSLAGPIPLVASRAVIRSLVRDGRWKELDAWCQTLWTRGFRDWIALTSTFIEEEDAPPAPWYEAQVSELKDFLMVWSKTLQTLGQQVRLQNLRRELESLHPGLGACVHGGS